MGGLVHVLFPAAFALVVLLVMFQRVKRGMIYSGRGCSGGFYSGGGLGGSGWSSGGGGWGGYAEYCRSAYRYNHDPGVLLNNGGFRLARSN